MALFKHTPKPNIGDESVIKGEDVFLPDECFDPTTYKRLRRRLHEANPSLLGYLNMVAMESKMSNEEQRRFLWLGHITLEIMGASNRQDADYVPVSDEYVLAAEQSQSSYDEEALETLRPSFGQAVAEAEEYCQLVNDYLNSCEENRIDWQKMWTKIKDTLIKAYAFVIIKKVVKDASLCLGVKPKEDWLNRPLSDFKH